jgi:hypothetical protein
MANEQKILIIGNDHNVNNIKFSKIKKKKKLVTIGLNRIWYKFIPDYIYFSDSIILREIIQYPDIMNKCKFITLKKNYIKGRNHIIDKLYDDGKLILYPKLMKLKYSGLNIIRIADKYLFPNHKCIFYLAAMSLKYNPILNHFWENDKKFKRLIKDRHLTRNWHEVRLRQQFRLFVNIKDQYSLVSVTPNSLLNTIIPYIHILKIK